MSNIKFEKVLFKDTELLANISKRAFNSDIHPGDKSEGGHPGYDSGLFYQKMIRVSKAFYKIILNNQIIGGFIIFDKSYSYCELGRIFIDPEFHRHGYGLDAINFLENTYKDIKKWTLETPAWNTRTISFYKKCGFSITGQNEKEVQFEKNL